MTTALLQLSNVFHKPAGDAAAYSRLCSSVVAIYNKTYPMVRTTMFEERFVRMLIGVVDDVCRFAAVDAIDPTIRFFYHVWFSYHTRSPEVWGVLRACHRRWITTNVVCSNWVRSMKEAQYAVVQSLVSPQERYVIRHTVDGTTYEAFVEHAEMALLWLKFLRLSENPVNLSDPTVNRTFMEGVHQLTVNLVQNNFNANHVLRIYGEILYQVVVYCNHAAFQESVCSALKTFVYVYEQQAATISFDPPHVYKLYKVFQTCLASPVNAISFEAIRQYVRLHRVHPTEVLLIDIFTAIRRIAALPKQETVDIRSDALLLLETIQFDLTDDRLSAMHTIDSSSTLADISLPVVLTEICFALLAMDNTLSEQLCCVLRRFLVDFRGRLERWGVSPNDLISRFATIFNGAAPSWISALDTTRPSNLVLLLQDIVDFPTIKTSVLVDILMCISRYLDVSIGERDSPVLLISVYTLYFTRCFHFLTLPQFSQLLLLNEKIIATTVRRNSYAMTFDVLVDELLNPNPTVGSQTDDYNELLLCADFEKKGFNLADHLVVLTFDNQRVFTAVQLPWEPALLLVIARTPYGKRVFVVSTHPDNTPWGSMQAQNATLSGQITPRIALPSKLAPPEDAPSIDDAPLLDRARVFKSPEPNNEVLTPELIARKCPMIQKNFPARQFFCGFQPVKTLGSDAAQLACSTALFTDLSALDKLSLVPTYHINILADTATTPFVSFISRLCDIERDNDAPLFVCRTGFVTFIFGVPALGGAPFDSPDGSIVWGRPLPTDKRPSLAITPTGTDLVVLEAGETNVLLLQRQQVSLETLPRLVISALRSFPEFSVFNRRMYDKRKEHIACLASHALTPPAPVALHLLFADSFLQDAAFRDVKPIVLNFTRPDTTPLAPSSLSRTFHMRSNRVTTASPGAAHQPADKTVRNSVVHEFSKSFVEQSSVSNSTARSKSGFAIGRRPDRSPRSHSPQPQTPE